MDVNYIVVQAGGKGTRLQYLTENRPKALVPIDNLPMLFHLFRKYPKKNFIIIGDYKKDVLKKYLKAFADVKYVVVDAEGAGTCAGIAEAISYIPEKAPFMLIWSDLILPDEFDLPKEEGNYIGISEDFPCRWSFMNGKFEEKPSTEFGVGGFFLFSEKALIADVDREGEFVRFLGTKDYAFQTVGLKGTKEFGLLSEYEKLKTIKCRPFNRMEEKDGMIIKEPIDRQGELLAEDERNWYRHVHNAGVQGLPKIYDLNPMRMEKINGKNVYEYTSLNQEQKKTMLQGIVKALKEVHALEKQPCDRFSMWEAYVSKTYARLGKIQSLVPFANEQYVSVNGRKCRNIFFYEDAFEKKVRDYSLGDFCLIHGDCTFSNIMVRETGEPVFIDPRGYFGITKLFGDPAYDWAKLYYSVVGNYDQFNLKRFRLHISDQDVELKIESNGWEQLEEEFFRLTGTNKIDIKLLHAIIWLSLTTYAWQDYDSICGAFYNGLYYLEEVL